MCGPKGMRCCPKQHGAVANAPLSSLTYQALPFFMEDIIWHLEGLDEQGADCCRITSLSCSRFDLKEGGICPEVGKERHQSMPRHWAAIAESHTRPG